MSDCLSSRPPFSRSRSINHCFTFSSVFMITPIQHL
nr:MAG TPA: hypothetical protein [Caudoviricetes sp.]